MARIAIAFGVLLTLLGIVLYTTSEPEHKSPTALIPSGFGLALVLLGQLARGASDRGRMHIMHAAALIGLIGFAIPTGRVVWALSQGAEVGRAIGGQIAMAVLCGIFLALCIKSFIDVRMARKRNAQGSAKRAAGDGMQP
jgi:hypothetical protein